MTNSNAAIQSVKPGILLIHGKTFRGKVFQVHGKPLEVFRVGALAYALHRQSAQIGEWEQDGLIPKPLIEFKTGPPQRWYTKAQIINIYNVWVAIPFRRGKPELGPKFFAAVKKVFYKEQVLSHGQQHHQSAAVSSTTAGKTQLEDPVPKRPA